MDKKKFTSISLQEEMQRSYLEYAMSVIKVDNLLDIKFLNQVLELECLGYCPSTS